MKHVWIVMAVLVALLFAGGEAAVRPSSVAAPVATAAAAAPAPALAPAAIPTPAPALAPEAVTAPSAAQLWWAELHARLSLAERSATILVADLDLLARTKAPAVEAAASSAPTIGAAEPAPAETPAAPRQPEEHGLAIAALLAAIVAAPLADAVRRLKFGRLADGGRFLIAGFRAGLTAAWAACRRGFAALRWAAVKAAFRAAWAAAVLRGTMTVAALSARLAAARRPQTIAEAVAAEAAAADDAASATAEA